MSRKVEKAMQVFGNGCNCSQAVLYAFKDEMKISEDEVKAMGKPYGGGAKIKCGAILAAEIVLANSRGIKDKESLFGSTKEDEEKLSEFEKRFMQINKAVNCRELKKGLRPCADCVKDSVAILEDML